MSQRLSPVLAYKKRVWSDVSTKASQYYKGRKNKLDLSYCKSVKLEWNPLLPKASNARWFKRTITMDNFTKNTLDKCDIIDDMHEREEPPKMSIFLNDPNNTTLIFDMRRMRWNHFVHELMLWCDYAKTNNQKDAWNAEKFGFGTEQIEILPELKARDSNFRRQKEINQFIFFDKDQPMQPNEFYNDNYNRKNNIIDSYAYSPKMEHMYSNERIPIWRSDFEFLHKSASYKGLPHFRYDYIVYDDNGLVYPNFNQIPKFYLDKIMDAQRQNDILSQYIYKYYKNNQQEK
eukprot:456955_1